MTDLIRYVLAVLVCLTIYAAVNIGLLYVAVRVVRAAWS